MDLQSHRRSTTEPRGASPSEGTPESNLALLVLLRVPDMKRARETLVSAAAEAEAAIQLVPASALYQSAAPAEESPKAEPPAAASAQKTWRNDPQHAPFRPEKYRSNLTTKLIAGSLSLAAIVLVYLALFGGGSANEPNPAGEWAASAIDQEWTDSEGELKVDLGSEAEIGESSPLAPPFAAGNMAVNPRSEPALAHDTSEIVEAAMATPSPRTVDARPSYPPRVAEETPANLSGVLPWRQNETASATDSGDLPAGRGSASEGVAPGDSDFPLNAPLTRGSVHEPRYATDNRSSAGSAYPTTGYSSEGFAPAGVSPGGYPATTTPNGYAPADYAPAAQGPAAAYQARNPYPATGYAAQPELAPNQQPTYEPAAYQYPASQYPTSGYPSTAEPSAPSYAPGIANPYYPANAGSQSDSSDSSPGWRR